MVKPDKRKGKVVVCIEEQLLHFQWKEREATNASIVRLLKAVIILLTIFKRTIFYSLAKPSSLE